jgi:hypothetical protein
MKDQRSRATFSFRSEAVAINFFSLVPLVLGLIGYLIIYLLKL